MIAKVIKINETASREDCHNIRGGSGELGCWQIMPSTYKHYSIQVLGYVAEPTPINQEYIATVAIGRLLDKHPIEKVLLKWNAGENAETCRSGVNKYGVKFDSCHYVQKGLAIYNKIK